MKIGTLLIDFDSTWVTIESLDELASICLVDHPEKEEKVRRIKEITTRGMNREISFPQSLQLRLAEFSPHRDDVLQLIALLGDRISLSFLNHKEQIQQSAENIYIVSGGFQDFIKPIAREFGIPDSNILANKFLYDFDGHVVGFDEKNPLAQEGGKILATRDLPLLRPIVAIGDGGTDYQLREAGVADIFCAYTETVARQTVVEKADKVITSFSEVAQFLSIQEGVPPYIEQPGQRTLYERR